MADAEHLLISKVCYRPETFTEVIGAGIARVHFHDELHGEVWDWLVSFWETHAKVPSRDTLRMQYPTYELVKVPEPIDFYIDQLNIQHRRFETLTMLADAGRLAAEEQFDEARRELSQRLLWVEQDTYRTSDDNFNESWSARLERYQALVDDPSELKGIPTGFPTFDKITAGFQPEQFIVLIGAAKAGKSSVLLRCAKAANEANFKVLVIGFEMSNDEQAARLDGLRGGFNYNLLLQGRMGPRERAALERAGKEAENLPEMIFVHDMASATTLTAVAAKIQEYRPDIVFIDGVYMMDSEVDGAEPMDTRALTKLSRGLKRLAQVRKIPVVATTQALDWKFNKKQGLTARAVGYTSAFAQDCDFLFGVEAIEEEPYKAKMRLIAGRTAPRSVIMVDFDWDNGTIEEEPTWTGDEEEHYVSDS